MYLLAASLAAAAAPAPPVEVLSREVALARHDRAPIEVRCNRTRRACRGVLTLGVAQCSSEPVAIQGCQLPVGRRRFAIPPGATRTVVVPRARPAEHVADGADSVTVRATPFLRRRARAWTTRWTRSVRLVAPAAVPRPSLPLELRAGDRHPFRLTGCGATSCVELGGEATLDRDHTRDPRPICRLRPLTAAL